MDGYRPRFTLTEPLWPVKCSEEAGGHGLKVGEQMYGTHQFSEFGLIVSVDVFP